MKINQKFLCILFLLVFMCIGIVNAETHSFDLTYSKATNYPLPPYYTNIGMGTTPWKLLVNFTTLTNPTWTVITIPTTSTFTSQTGTFEVTLSGKTISTGNYDFYSGIFSSISGGQLYLEYSNWNNQGYSGSNLASITFSPVLPLAGAVGYRGGQTLASDNINCPIILRDNTGYNAGQYYSTYDVLYAKNSFILDDNGGTSIINVDVKKNFNAIGYPSLLKVFSGNTLLYQDAASNSNNENFNVNGKPIIIQINVLKNILLNSTEYFLPPEEVYSVVYTPIIPLPNQTTTAIISNSNVSDSALSKIYYINCDVYNSNGELMNNKMSATYPYGFNFLKKLDGTWQYYDGSGYVGNLGTTTPNNIPFTLPTSGTFILNWTFIDTKEKMSYVSNNITLSGNVGQNTVNVYPVSYLDSSFVSGTEIEIKDMAKNTWINKTVNSLEDCRFYLNDGYYNFNAAKAIGYSDQMNDVRYISSSQAIQLVLYPEETDTDLEKSTGYFNIEYEPNLYPLTGASVTVSNSTYTETKLSSQSGTVSFELNNLTTYKMVVSKTGYTTATQFFTTNSRYYYLNVIVSAGSGVITYPPTTFFTTFPTTPVYGINNTVNGSVCGGNYSNIVDYFKGEIACWGVTGKESQNLLFGCIITIGAALIVGSKGKNGIGSIIGALVGFIVSVALGLFPFWLLIAAIVLSGVILFAVFKKE